MSVNVQQAIARANTRPPVVDDRPGSYYVSVVDGEQVALLSGPWPTHQEALDRVRACKRLAHEQFPKSVFFAFGTLRHDPSFNRPGRYTESDLGLPVDWTKSLNV